MTIRTAVVAALAACVGGIFLGATAAPPATRPAAPRPAAGAPVPPAVPEVADKPLAKPGGWMQTHNRYVEKAKAGNIDLYMLGDSITDFWGNNPRYKPNWEKNLGGWKPGDFGISGDRTQNVLFRLQNGELDGVKPKAIVLLIGTNNLPPAANNTPEDTAKGVKAILDLLREKQPQAKILLMAIFPREDQPKAGPDIQQKIDATNALIQKFADGTTIKYLDISKQLLDANGKLTKDVMPDLLHPNDKGYQIWADAIKPQLTEWLGAPAATQPG